MGRHHERRWAYRNLSPDRHTVAEWHSDRRLRLAARDLFEALKAQTGAAQAVIDAWTRETSPVPCACWTVPFLRRATRSPRQRRRRPYTTHVRCFPKGSDRDAETLELCYRDDMLVHTGAITAFRYIR
jgi:hypothetical protein